MNTIRALLIVCLVLIVGISCFAEQSIYHLKMDSSINPITKDLFIRTLDEAEQANAALLVVELNTPGGLGESIRDIVAAELSAAIPIIVYVSPPGARAASAGVFFVMAADIAAMSPSTNIGAAHPVNLMGTGQDEQDPTMEAKMENDTAAFAKSIAEQRNRNADWAEKAVRESSSLTASEALENNVVDLIADDMTDLLTKLDGYVLPDGRVIHSLGLPIEKIQPTFRERLLGYLADPNVVYILFILGLYGLMYEFFHPGIGFGLATGGTCLVLAFMGLQILPVNVVGVALILFGVGLMVLDVFTPTSGILTTGGVVALLAGSVTLFDISNRAIALSWTTIFITVAAVTSLFVFIVSKGLLVQKKRPVTGSIGMIGLTGIARTDLNPEGTVFVKGEYWNARSTGEKIYAGDRIVVDEAERGRLIVKRQT